MLFNAVFFLLVYATDLDSTTGCSRPRLELRLLSFRCVVQVYATVRSASFVLHSLGLTFFSFFLLHFVRLVNVLGKNGVFGELVVASSICSFP